LTPIDEPIKTVHAAVKHQVRRALPGCKFEFSLG
jgi:hypothetical protein